MSERKPSERWVVEGAYATMGCGPFSAFVAGFDWDVVIETDVGEFGEIEIAEDTSTSFEAAQLAAEDVLLEIAREIREAVGR